MPRTPKADKVDTVPVEATPAAAPTPVQDATAVLAAALVQAIEQTRPTPKKHAFNRKVGTPWSPKDGSAKHKLKKKVFQHGIPIDEDNSSNEEIDLMNRLRPGSFMTGDVKVLRRKDRGLDIDYPIKSAAQKLRLISKHGITSFTALLQRLVLEGENPSQYKVEDLD